MNYEAITIEDCIDMFEKKNCVSIIEDGVVKGFKERYEYDGE